MQVPAPSAFPETYKQRVEPGEMETTVVVVAPVVPFESLPRHWPETQLLRFTVAQEAAKAIVIIEGEAVAQAMSALRLTTSIVLTQSWSTGRASLPLPDPAQ